MTNDSDSFIQEVNEQVRQDQAQLLLKKYGPYFLGLFVLVLVAVGGWEAYRYFSVNASREHAGEFAAAQELARTGDLEGAEAAFEALSDTGPSTYRVMAMMERAALQQAQGDLQGALASFDAAAESARDPLVRATAQYRAASIVAETQDFEAVQARLNPLIAEDTHISYLAKELLGVEAWEAGQEQLARETLQALSLAFEAPEGVRQRAQLALSVLGPGPVEAAPAAEAATPAPEAAPQAGESQ